MYIQRDKIYLVRGGLGSAWTLSVMIRKDYLLGIGELFKVAEERIIRFNRKTQRNNRKLIEINRTK